MCDANLLHYKNIIFINHKMLGLIDILVTNIPIILDMWEHYMAFLEPLFVTASSYLVINSQTHDWFSSLLPAPALSQQAYTSSHPLIIPILIIRPLPKQPNILHSANLI